MKRFITLIIVLFTVLGGIYYLVQDDFFANMKKPEEQVKRLELPDKKKKQEKKELIALFKGDLFSWMGKTSNELKDNMGKPDKKHQTPFGYTWWVYTDGESNYIQFGIDDKKIETVFATGEDVSADPFHIGDSYESIQEQFPIEEKVTYNNGLAFYSFLLNDQDKKLHPLLKISDNLFVQAYMDSVKDELSSIRLLTGDVLLKQRFYEMEYRGQLPETDDLNDEDWKKVMDGMEEQIFDITNVYRNRFGVSQLQQDDQASEVALLHSKDMHEHHYFSHYSEDGKSLKDRLAEKDVYYLSAGENIAAQYSDAPAAMEGWLNSESHREALLNDDYTHLGVGVFKKYYTQNFLLKP